MSFLLLLLAMYCYLFSIRCALATDLRDGPRSKGAWYLLGGILSAASLVLLAVLCY